MCCPCQFLCCGSDEFAGCGCNDCPDPRCQDAHAGEARVQPRDLADEDDGVDLPLAALALAPARFRCVEVA